MKVAQWIRHWFVVLDTSQGGHHPQLEPDVSTMIFHQGSMLRATKGSPKIGESLQSDRVLMVGSKILWKR